MNGIDHGQCPKSRPVFSNAPAFAFEASALAGYCQRLIGKTFSSVFGCEKIMEPGPDHFLRLIAFETSGTGIPAYDFAFGIEQVKRIIDYGLDEELKFNYIILKLLTLPYRYFFGHSDHSLCQDQLYVSRTHDVVRACDEDGGYRAVCDRGDQHRRTIRRHGWSARGNAASLGRPVYVFLALDYDSTFISSARHCEPRTEQRYGDLSHGLCSDRPTMLDVAQYISCICNVAGGRFGAQPRPNWAAWLASCSQRHRIHRLYLHRPAILPRNRLPQTTRPWYDFVLRVGLAASLVGVVLNSKLSNWPDGSGCCCVPGYLHQHYAHSASAALAVLPRQPCWRTPFPLLPDLAWHCSACISPQCRLDPVQPSSSPSAFPSFGMPLFMQYVAAKLLLDYLARPGRLSKTG